MSLTQQYIFLQTEIKETTNISVNPNIQNRVLDIASSQSAGVLLGFVALPLIVYYWLGGNKLMDAFTDSQRKSAEAMVKIAESFNSVTKELNNNHNKYVGDHNQILNDVQDNKARLVTIESKLDRISESVTRIDIKILGK